MRTIIAYLVLVGIPLVGLVAILDAGADLTAPRVVHGDWVLEGGAASCLAQPGTFTISQSGRFLAVQAGGPSGRGRLEGDDVHLAFSPGAGPCAGVELTIDGVLEADVIRGIAKAPGCAPCDVPTLTARRAPAPAAK